MLKGEYPFSVCKKADGGLEMALKCLLLFLCGGLWVQGSVNPCWRSYPKPRCLVSPSAAPGVGGFRWFWARKGWYSCCVIAGAICSWILLCWKWIKVTLASYMWSCLWFRWLWSGAVEFCRFQRYGDTSMLFKYMSLWLTSDCFGILVIRMIGIGLIGPERVRVACCLAAGSCWFLNYVVLTAGSYTR
jgi:hypothetical protein